MNRDGVALTITRVSTPANSISRSEPGKGKSRAARKRRSAAAIKAAHQLPAVEAVHQLPAVELRTIASTSSSVLRTTSARRSATHGRIRLLEHRTLVLQAQLSSLRDEFAQYRADHPSICIPKLVFPRSQGNYTTLPDSARRYLLANRHRPSASCDSD